MNENIALNKFVYHPSIFKIKEYFNKPIECNFSEVTPNNIKNEIKSLDSSKKVTFKNITPKSLNKGQDICVIMRYMSRKNCAKRHFSKELDLFFFKKKQLSFKN